MSEKITVNYLALITKDDTILSVPSLTVALEGIDGDKHFGFVKKADARDSGLKRGSPVRNWRQWSAVSEEELAQIAAGMSVSEVLPEMLSANICLSGIAELTRSKPGSRLCFESGAILQVEGRNEPCIIPGRKIAAVHEGAKAAKFAKVALYLRGLVGVVHRPGKISLFDEVKVLEPI